MQMSKAEDECALGTWLLLLHVNVKDCLGETIVPILCPLVLEEQAINSMQSSSDSCQQYNDSW